MPYLITDSAEGCSGWATIKEDGEVMGCHTTKQDAIDQALAIAQAEGSEFLGERALPENYRPATAEDVPEGRACGNCHFFNEEDVAPDGRARCMRWDEYVDGGFYCNAWEPPEENRAEPDELEVGDFVQWESSGGTAQGQIERIVRDGQIEVPDSEFVINGDESDPAALIRIWRPVETEEDEQKWAPTATQVAHRFSTLTKIDELEEVDEEERQVDLEPPAYMRASARRGLEWHREGLSGDGLVDRTVREARAMAEGNVTADKWSRIAAWIARHLVDLDAPAASPDHPSYPSPGVVAMALWGGGVNRRQAERAMEYAQRVVGRIEAENEDRVTGEAVSKLETRQITANLEVREVDGGMLLEGYAARFNEFSEPLPFREKIAPGAFQRSLRSRNDVKLLWNHDSSTVLGSTRSGTLRLYEDAEGLRVEADLPDTQAGRDARTLIQRGDVTGFSFGFTVPQGGDSWNEDGSERTLHSVRLFEVSTGVAFPAYPTTNGTATVRGLSALAIRADVDVDALADAVLKLENGEDISDDDRTVIETVLNELAPRVESEEPEQDEDEEKARQLLQLKKKKLQLLMGL